MLFCRRLAHTEFYVYLLVKKNARSLIPEQKYTSERKNLQRPPDYLPANRCLGALAAWPSTESLVQCSINMPSGHSFTARAPRPH